MVTGKSEAIFQYLKWSNTAKFSWRCTSLYGKSWAAAAALLLSAAHAEERCRVLEAIFHIGNARTLNSLLATLSPAVSVASTKLLPGATVIIWGEGVSVWNMTVAHVAMYCSPPTYIFGGHGSGLYSASYVGNLNPFARRWVWHQMKPRSLSSWRVHCEWNVTLSAVLAIVNPSVRPSVRHTLALCQNDLSYDHGVFTGG